MRIKNIGSVINIQENKKIQVAPIYLYEEDGSEIVTQLKQNNKNTLDKIIIKNNEKEIIDPIEILPFEDPEVGDLLKPI